MVSDLPGLLLFTQHNAFRAFPPSRDGPWPFAEQHLRPHPPQPPPNHRQALRQRTTTSLPTPSLLPLPQDLAGLGESGQSWTRRLVQRGRPWLRE